EDLDAQSLGPSEKDHLMLLLKDVVDARMKDPSLSGQMIHKKISEAIQAVTGKIYPVSLVDAACASSLYTLDLGILELLKGNVDLAICGGISFNDPVGKVLFCRLGGSSRQGVFPFQSRADGTVFGEGAGFVGIKLLSRALRDGDTVYSVIRGIGTASDGKGKSIYAPNSDGQVLAIDKAYKSTKIDPKTLQYVEAHGTGTPAGDSVEFKSLQTFFNGHNIPKQSVGLGSVKGLFGHLGWAAGVASVIKLALCLRNKTLVGQHHFESINPLIDLDKSPFVINRQNSHWPENRLEPRRACINGFGFGGTNAHLIIEEFTGKDVSPKVTAPVPNDKIVIVGVGCVLPEANSWTELSTAFDARRTLASRYANGYKPNNIKFRIIDRSASVIDPTQFMLLEATGQVVGQLGERIQNLREEVGVFVAQANCLSKQLPHMKRVYVEAVKNRIESDPMLSKVTKLNVVAETLTHTYKTEIPVPNEDSNPGIMPNVMAGRICNYYDFNGPNLSISAGFGTFSETLSTAITNLRYNKCQIAMVATANATTSSAFESLWQEWSGRPAAEMAEGALVLGLMKETDAIRQGI
ncbi:MAG: beta-ketoacyl synthase N-terminal-like domain-containing protein, partial [Pseudobdellovibrionaceae bacterium]